METKENRKCIQQIGHKAVVCKCKSQKTFTIWNNVQGYAKEVTNS
jgi:hypothetical protein